MAKYLAIFEDRNGEIVTTIKFSTDTIVKAKKLAQMQKRWQPEIQEAKGVKVTVKRIKE